MDDQGPLRETACPLGPCVAGARDPQLPSTTPSRPRAPRGADHPLRASLPTHAFRRTASCEDVCPRYCMRLCRQDAVSRSPAGPTRPPPDDIRVVGYRSGQTGQTVNLLAMPSVVRIHPPPPLFPARTAPGCTIPVVHPLSTHPRLSTHCPPTPPRATAVRPGVGRTSIWDHPRRQNLYHPPVFASGCP